MLLKLATCPLTSVKLKLTVLVIKIYDQSCLQKQCSMFQLPKYLSAAIIGYSSFLFQERPEASAQQTECKFQRTGIIGTRQTGEPREGDCRQALTQLQAKNGSCSVPNSTVPDSPTTFYLRTSGNVALTTAGSCQIIMGGKVGATLACSQLAAYAGKLIGACSTLQQTTGGVYYLEGYPNGIGDADSTYVALSDFDRSSG